MKRIHKFLEKLKENQLDGFLVSSEANVTYLSGFTGDSSLLFVSANRCMLLTDGRYTEQARIECPPEIEVFKWKDNKRYGIETYQYIAVECHLRNLGFESSVMSFSTWEMLRNGLHEVELVPTSGLIENLRMVKDEQEIAALRTACEISDRSLEQTIPFIREGVTEMEIVARLEFNMKNNGAGNLSFDTMVLSGAKTSMLHGKPDGKRLEKGDWVLFDFGALYNGFHADISRTFILGQASDEQRELYALLQKAQHEAVQASRHGVIGHFPDTKVRETLSEKYLPYYYPGLGHGVGLQIHELPFLGQTCEARLVKDMVLTIEPGVYIPGWGGMRIEDTILVQDQAPELLTNFPRDLMVL